MFTGIIESVGTVVSQNGDALIIRAAFINTLKPGQSVAVNGVCLTVVKKNRAQFQVQVLEETRRLTNLGNLKPGDLVNLERAMKASGRFDGHIVQGHVEGIGNIVDIEPENPKSEIRNPKQIPNSKFQIPNSGCTWLMTLRVAPNLRKYMILKGIVILDGIALTITRLDDRKAEIDVAITAYTWENTNLHLRKVGDRLNIETDVFEKYVERQLTIGHWPLIINH